MFTYLQPKSVDEAADLLHSLDDARIMAGGTDLLVMLRDGLSCRYVMDIKNIPDMNLIEMTDSGLAVGGAVPLNKVLSSDIVTGCYFVLKEAASKLANHLLRNRATLIGNICNASPGGDMIGASLVLDGYLEAASVEGIRKIALSEFFTGVKTHSLRKDELAVRIIFPMREGKGVYLKKQRIRGHDIAQAGVTVFRRAGGLFDIALGAVGPKPILIRGITAEGVVNAALGSISPIDDVRGSREYRIAMVKRFVSQAVSMLAGGEGAE